MFKTFSKFVIIFSALSWTMGSHAAPIVETFESFASGTIITNQLIGLNVSAADGGSARIVTATSPVVPGQAQGMYNDPSFVSALIIDFQTSGSSIGAIVDFGEIGTGLKITAYDGAGGTGNVLGTATTLTESFIGVNAGGIKSAIFSQAGDLSATWLIDNLTYDTQVVPIPAAACLFGSALLGLAGIRRKKA